MICKGCGKEFFNNEGKCNYCGFANYPAINQVIAKEEKNYGKFQQAKQTLTDAIEQNPDNSSLYEDRSEVNIMLNQHDKAIEDMANAIKRDAQKK